MINLRESDSAKRGKRPKKSRRVLGGQSADPLGKIVK